MRFCADFDGPSPLAGFDQTASVMGSQTLSQAEWTSPTTSLKFTVPPLSSAAGQVYVGRTGNGVEPRRVLEFNLRVESLGSDATVASLYAQYASPLQYVDLIAYPGYVQLCLFANGPGSANCFNSTAPFPTGAWVHVQLGLDLGTDVAWVTTTTLAGGALPNVSIANKNASGLTGIEQTYFTIGPSYVASPTSVSNAFWIDDLTLELQ